MQTSSYTQKLLAPEALQAFLPPPACDGVWIFRGKVLQTSIGPNRKERLHVLFLPCRWPLWGPCNTSACPKLFEDGSLCSVDGKGVAQFYYPAKTGTCSRSLVKPLNYLTCMEGNFPKNLFFSFFIQFCLDFFFVCLFCVLFFVFFQVCHTKFGQTVINPL